MTECFEYALAIDSHCTNTYNDMAAIYNFNSMFGNTIDTVNEAVNNGIETPQLYCMMAEAQNKSGLVEDAMKSFEKHSPSILPLVPLTPAKVSFS